MAYSVTNLHYIRKGYLRNVMRQKLLPVWMYWGGFNAFMSFVMLKPLRSEEISVQVSKRLVMGKWLYSTFHLNQADHQYSTWKLV